MKIELEIEIDAPREQVWNLFTSHTMMPQWQMGLKKVTEEKGDNDDAADANEVFLLHYKIGERTEVVRETVSESLEPELFQAAYDHPRIPAHVVSTSRFIVEESRTLWQVEQYITFTRLDYRLFGGLLRSILRQQQVYDMLRFKEWAEKKSKETGKKTSKKTKKTKTSAKKKKKK